MTRLLPSFLQNITAPPAGAGVHKWLFSTSRQLHVHMPAPEIVEWLTTKTASCGRSVPKREIIAAVNDALGCAWTPTKGGVVTVTTSKWPQVNQEQRNAIVKAGGGLCDLWEASPIRIEDNDEHAEAIIDQLFPGNPLLCCGESSQVFDTKPRDEWRGQMHSLSLIVPSPMAAIEGTTKEGKQSKHCLDNTGPRRFLVCEFDQGAIDEHAALLLHLARLAPMVAAVHSGGKSLHGWFAVEGEADEKVQKFFRYAVSLGADPALWTRSQFCRMPDGTRDNGKRQTVFFLNFNPLKKH